MNIDSALEILEIHSEHPTIDEVKKSYRKQQLKWHPDRHVGKETICDAVVKSAEINNAYEILTELYENIATLNINQNRRKKKYSPRHQYSKKKFTPGFPDENVFEFFIKSSHIISIGYSKESHIFYIKFSTNIVYMYFNVPNRIFDEFMHASSHGKYGNKNIYYSFEYKRCEEPNRPYSGPKIDKNGDKCLCLSYS